MTDTLAIALAQLNPTVGDIAGNLAKLRAARGEAAQAGADLVIFTELVITGYPPEDLVLKPSFQEAARAAVENFARDTADGGPAVLLGTPWLDQGKLYNAAALLEAGRVAALRYKYDLPNYGVFDEKRVFAPGPLPGPIPFRGCRLGVMVCEDMWTPEVTECLGECGAELLIVINGSPFEMDKQDVRLNLAVARITESGLPLLYLNQVGGQDELVFDGSSFVLGHDRALRAQAPGFAEALLLTRWRKEADEVWRCAEGPRPSPAETLEAIYRAMVLGLRDYAGKNRFPGVLIGLSGGIDSALTAVVAVDALGPEAVHGVMMPSRYTAKRSLEDASELARRLGIRLDSVPIEPAVEAFARMLRDPFANYPPDTTEENIQARVRGIVLMALSNKFGHLVVSTGNKSEMSVGYATLYGDMCGGFSVLKDVYKTTVYRLSRWRNANRCDGFKGPEGALIPEHILTRPPSAELKANQTDQDSLPPYDVLDGILHGLIERDLGLEEAVAQGYDRATVLKVWSMVDKAEYKRRQAPPGVKLTRRSFGKDRRYPITNRFKPQL
jgi:NAD+ synthase